MTRRCGFALDIIDEDVILIERERCEKVARYEIDGVYYCHEHYDVMRAVDAANGIIGRIK